MKNTSSKRHLKSSLDVIKNIREKESQYFEMFDFMRELENDHNKYQMILK